MAYVNVKDWSVDQVTDWLKGLDNVILQYNASFLNNGVTGHQLLNLRVDDLENLGVKALGHQEIILEAVGHLRNFHYELDRENLQSLALRLSCAANSLYKELLLVDDDSKMVQTQVMSDVHTIITTIKPLVFWLDRSPFAGNKDYIDMKINMLQLSFEMATSAHRDIFSEKPVRTIKEKCETLARMADHIIQEISDPMILQPASLDLATLKKKEQELGFFILPNNHAIHQIADIKFGSPAHGSSKIEEGDEIVQVNYQTIVGWQRKKVMMLLQESPPDIVLTLKKRPRHTKVYGQIYMKPYRLPSRKRGGENWSKWNDNLPSPRLLPILDLPPINIPKVEKIVVVPDVEAELSSSDSEPPDSPLDGSCRMYPCKPRPILQRRNTITGATPTNKRPYPSIDQYWDFINPRNSTTRSSSYAIDDTNGKFDEDSKFLRDKSASCTVGLDLSPRPTTVIGLSHNRGTPCHKKSFKDKPSSSKKRVNFEDKKEKDTLAVKNERFVTNLDEEKSVSVNSLSSVTNEQITFIDEGQELTGRTSMTSDTTKGNEVPKPKFGDVIDADKENHAVNVKDPILAEIKKVQGIIKQFDDPKKFSFPKQTCLKPKVSPRIQGKKPPDVPHKPGGPVKKPDVPPRSSTTKLRGRLDKSHSTPAYDLTCEEDHQPKSPNSERTEILDNKLPDILPKIPDTILETSPVEKEPDDSIFGDSPLQHGIPVIEACNTTVVSNVAFEVPGKDTTVTVVEEKVTENVILVADPEPQIADMPPKPPPRIFIDIPKPDVPKTISLSSRTTPVKKHFEIAETKSLHVISHSRQTSVDLQDEDYLVPIQFPTPVGDDRFHHGREAKGFDPKIVSTPVSKTTRMDFSEIDVVSYSKSVLSHDYQKVSGSGESKVSPTNSIVKAMMSGKGISKSGKKKNTLIAKRRKVTVNDLSPVDVQGYLYQRLRGKHNQNVHWAKRWFVLLGNCLYGYKSKEDARAACLIFLSGFTVAVASEVKSRSNAFKVYHTGTVFYFSAEDADTLQTWIELIKAACLHAETSSKTEESMLYSESDDSDAERPVKQPSSEKSDTFKKFGSLKKFTSKKSSSESSPSSGSTSLDRKWFFNRSSSHSKHSIPVPTAQFRSYRKILADDAQSSVRTGNFTSHIAMFEPTSNLNQSQNVSVPNLTIDSSGGSSMRSPREALKPTHKSVTQTKTTKQMNFVHASNPSLCNVGDFGSLSGFVGCSAKSGGYKGGNESLSGFMTLEELMNRQNEEKKLNPHHVAEEMRISLQMIKPDVVYGEVPVRPKTKVVEEKPPAPPQVNEEYSSDVLQSRRSSSTSDHQDSASSSCFGKRLGSLKKSHVKTDTKEFECKTSTYPKTSKSTSQKTNRSLPRTLKEGYSEVDFEASGSSSVTNLQSAEFKDRSYEMIYGAETITNYVQYAQNRTLDDTMHRSEKSKRKSSRVKKQRSVSSADGKRPSNSPSESSSKFQFPGHGLKPAHQYTPMSLPLSHQEERSRPKFAFELNVDDKDNRPSKSSGAKLKHMFGGSGKSEKKEKTFLGSPKLHRAIFRKHGSGTDLSRLGSSSPTQPVSLSQSSFSLENAVSPSEELQFQSTIRPHADYPGLKYPPVFEPETYSLANPQSSLDILRKRAQKDAENDL